MTSIFRHHEPPHSNLPFFSYHVLFPLLFGEAGLPHGFFGFICFMIFLFWAGEGKSLDVV